MNDAATHSQQEPSTTAPFAIAVMAPPTGIAIVAGTSGLMDRTFSIWALAVVGVVLAGALLTRRDLEVGATILVFGYLATEWVTLLFGSSLISVCTDCGGHDNQRANFGLGILLVAFAWPVLLALVAGLRSTLRS